MALAVLLAAATLSLPAPAGADAPPLPPGPAYWMATADGGVFAYGRAGFSGSMSGAPLGAPVAAMASTPSGGG